MSLLKVNEVQNYNGSSLTLTASTVSTSAQLNTGGNISVTGSINVSDDSTTRSNLGLGTMATQNANAVAITGGTINTVQPATGQSLTIKDEDGNTAITIGTDNTAASYLSLNFGSYHGDSGGVGSGTLSANTLDDYETGSWSPAYNIGGASYSSNDGAYTKIGNTVIAAFSVSTSNTTSITGSGDLNITGLPFTIDSSSPRDVVAFMSGRFTSNNPNYGVLNSGTAIQLRSDFQTNTQISDLENNSNNNRNVVEGVVIYKV